MLSPVEDFLRLGTGGGGGSTSGGGLDKHSLLPPIVNFGAGMSSVGVGVYGALSFDLVDIFRTARRDLGLTSSSALWWAPSGVNGTTFLWAC